MEKLEKQENQNIPKLRFPEFSGEWEEKKLEDLGENIIGLTYSPNDIVKSKGVLVLRSSNIKNGYLDLADKVLVKLNIPQKLQIKKDDILICTRNGSQRLIGKNIIIRANEINMTFGAFMSVFRSEINNFIVHLFKTESYANQIHVNLGARINQITTGYLNKFKFFFPALLEQQKIANFLTLIDNRIEKLIDKKNLLENYKKGVMQQIFSQKIRFKDNNGNDYPDWEEKKLGDICKITTGKLDANAMTNDGKYRFYTCAKEYYLINEYAFDTEALLVSGNGANVGYIHHYKGKFNAYQRTYVMDNFQDNIVYTRYFLDKNLSQRIGAEKKAGNTPYIVISTLSEMKINFPSLQEQQKIANFLTSLDKKIENMQIKIEESKIFKKGLLQKMFV
jgi:type I restriction enzyme S subunit